MNQTQIKCFKDICFSNSKYPINVEPNCKHLYLSANAIMALIQVESLRQKCELQELELQKSAKKVQEAMVLAAEESAKSKAAKEVIKSLTSQVTSA